MTIARLNKPDPRTFVEKHVKRLEPAIINGLTDDWRALQWTPEKLAAEFPAARVRYEISGKRAAKTNPVEWQNTQVFQHAPLAEFVTKLTGPSTSQEPNPYAMFHLFDVLPQLRDDIGSLKPYMGLHPLLPDPIQQRCMLEPVFWMGPAHSVSHFHFDRAHNFFVQIFGKKRWLLVPPEDSDEMYFPCAEFTSGLMHFSPVKADAPDLKRFPRFARARVTELIVEPGEVLWVPAGWWHYVESLDVSISFNFFWVLPLRNALSLRRYLFASARRRLLGSIGGPELAARFEHRAVA
jgi:[protein]-arginine 3-hydroxylase / protease